MQGIEGKSNHLIIVFDEIDNSWQGIDRFIGNYRSIEMDMTSTAKRAGEWVIRNRSTKVFINGQLDLFTHCWTWQSNDGRVREVFNANWIVHTLDLGCGCLSLSRTLHLNSQSDIFLEDVFRNVRSSTEGRVTINKMHTCSIRLN